MVSKADFTSTSCYTQSCCLRAPGDDEVYGGSDNSIITMSTSTRVTTIAIARPALRPDTIRSLTRPSAMPPPTSRPYSRTSLYQNITTTLYYNLQTLLHALAEANGMMKSNGLPSKTVTTTREWRQSPSPCAVQCRNWRTPLANGFS